MNRETKYNKTIRDIALTTITAILSFILGSGIGLLILFHVLMWKSLNTQFMFWATWAVLPIVLYLRSLLKKHLNRI